MRPSVLAAPGQNMTFMPPNGGTRTSHYFTVIAACRNAAVWDNADVEYLPANDRLYAERSFAKAR